MDVDFAGQGKPPLRREEPDALTDLAPAKRALPLDAGDPL